MATTAQAPTPTTTDDPVLRWLARRSSCPQPEPIPNPQSPTPEPRTRANRANAKLSTGPRTEPGKQRSSQNAFRHGLTARTAVLPTEDPEAHQRHVQQFLDEYQPATATETQLVHEIANTAWRLNRIPFLEADLLSQHLRPQTLIPLSPRSDCTARASPASSKKPLDQLRDIQEERRHPERRQLNEAAELYLRHQHKGLPWDPRFFTEPWLRFFKRTNRAPRTKADSSEPGLLRHSPPFPSGPAAHCQVR